MDNKTNKNIEKNIVVSINGKEVNRIPLKRAMERMQTIRDIVIIESDKSSDIRAVEKFFVHVNGKNVLPKDVEKMNIEDVITIEIFDKEPVDHIK